jgi:hypothetical protein
MEMFYYDNLLLYLKWEYTKFVYHVSKRLFYWYIRF